MKTGFKLLAVCHLPPAICLSVHAQGTAFTYQGRLNDGTSPANGIYDLRFAIYDSLTSGTQQGVSVTNAATAVSNGLFTTTLDFGNQFPGASRYLEMSVRTNGNSGFNTLVPRQPVTPTPYAITAENVAGAITVQNNANGAPNIIGGSSGNYAASGIIGGTISGGGSMFDPAFGSPGTNSVTANFGTVNGGDFNTASGVYATVSGLLNNASGDSSVVSGGYNNLAIGIHSVVGGGENNIASGADSMVSGGDQNVAIGTASVVDGGFRNSAAGSESFAAGQNAVAIHDNSFVWNDAGPTFSSTTTNQFAVHANGGVRLVGNVTTGDISLSENTAYHKLVMSGGNSIGYLYGAYNYLNQDGIQLAYNFYADNAGTPHIINTGGATSRIIAGYGEIDLMVGGVNSFPNTVQLAATTRGVTVYGTFVNDSDRNVKQDFASVSSAQLLEKVLQLPLSEWSYKVDPTTRHVGPMAQDFHSLFNLGADDKHIAPIDESGVAFAAIQGLNQKLQDELGSLRAENAELKQRLDALEKKIRN